MKKLTEKDAIWCKTQKQWKKVLKFMGAKSNLHFYEKGVTDVIIFGGSICNVHTANRHNHKIHKAKDILKKSKIKELEKRVSKLEKFASDNTTIGFHQPEIISTQPLKFDLPTKELEELPEKWCIKLIREQSLIDWINQNQQQFVFEVSEILEDPIRNLYFHSKADGNYAFKNIHVRIKDKSFTEITFDQFKKWVLKEEVKSLSIREVQVKVSSQEEANECAEIAKEFGELIGNIEFDINRSYVIFRYGYTNGSFNVFSYGDKKEISIQEYRERYGKPATEIEWTKAGQLVESEWGVVMTLGPHKEESDTSFYGVVVKPKKFEKIGRTQYNFAKSVFKLCTEPITLKNE